MRILTLCYEYPPLGGGGGRVAQSVAEQLASRGHQVRVQTAALGWSSVRETIHGVEICRTFSGRRVPDTCTVPEMGAYLATSFLPTLHHIRQWKPDVIHAHFAMPTGVLACAAHLITRVPYVLTAHLGDVPGGVPDQTDALFQIVGPVAHQIWRHAARATAVSSFVQELAQDAYARPVVRILNGVDLRDAASSITSDRREPRFIFLGRFNPQKNPVYLISLLSRMTDLPWKLFMIGDGPLMPEVRTEIARHHLEDRVTCTGWIDSAKVNALLRESDVLCMPSLSEGMPVAGVEALKHGLAIAGSDIPGLRDVIENGANGWLLPLSNEPLFCEKLRSLCTEPARLRSMREASLRKARNFDLSVIVSQYEKVLQEAIAASPLWK